jgi:hypothetical protein
MYKIKISDEEKAEKKRIAAAKERVRRQMALSTILSTMGHIAREEVCHRTLDLWRSELNVVRKVGEKIKLPDFLVGVVESDPFNADAPSQKALAEWFVEQWHRFKPGAQTVHVRGLHYAIQALSNTPDAVYLPNGVLYENTHLRWNDLQRAGKYARYLGLIDPDAFEDKRSQKPILQEFEMRDRSLYIFDRMYAFDSIELESFPSFPSFPSMPTFPTPCYSLFFRGQQRYRLEVWIEKSTQEDVILPVCEKHKVTSVTAQGEISISSMLKAIKRAEQYNSNTTTVILYVSDFDPAGLSMPVAASRKLEFLRMMRRSSVNMRLYPIALTHEQCIHYQLPRAPINTNERRKAGFEYRYGDGSTELDTLEVFHPGELAKIVEQAILRFRDTTIRNRVWKKREEIEEELHTIESEVRSAHDMDELKREYEKVESALSEIEVMHRQYEERYAAFIEEYGEEIRTAFTQWLHDHFEPFSQNLSSAMDKVTNDLYEKMPDIDAYEMPEAEEIPLDDACLFDSTREYIPQLAAYKQFAGKFSHLVEDENGSDEDE